jgi:hypothetical protein
MRSTNDSSSACFTAPSLCVTGHGVTRAGGIGSSGDRAGDWACLAQYPGPIPHRQEGEREKHGPGRWWSSCARASRGGRPRRASGRDRAARRGATPPCVEPLGATAGPLLRHDPVAGRGAPDPLTAPATYSTLDSYPRPGRSGMGQQARTTHGMGSPELRNRPSAWIPFMTRLPGRRTAPAGRHQPPPEYLTGERPGAREAASRTTRRRAWPARRPGQPAYRSEPCPVRK